MEVAAVKQSLMAVLAEIQEQSGLACPPLTGTFRPVESLPEFSSKMWAVATSLLADKIGASIPNDANIFMNKNTKQVFTIDEAAELVCQLLAKQSLTNTVAA
jgi:hypothetical protein